MNDSGGEFAELHSLLDALCEESITAEQMQRLEQLVLSHPEAEAYYVQFMSLHADLIAHFGVLPARMEQSLRNRVEAEYNSAEMKPLAAAGMADQTWSAIRRYRRFLWYPVGLLGLAAGLVLALMFWNPRPSYPDLGQIPLVDHESEVLDDTVAVLLYATGAQWEQMDLPTTAGSPLQPGWLRLKSGLAHIEFYSGANVILEGPAEFQIISRMEGYCARGKLRATVPPQAQGFQIGSPKMNLIDRGTEFGLMVTEGGPTELHVFQGKVEFDERKAVDTDASYTALTTGQSVRLDGHGQVSPIELNSAAFHTAADVVASSEAETRRCHQDWLASCSNLRHDPTLLVHFTFQAKGLWSRTLVNDVEKSQVQDGAIVGCSWIAGRWAGKQGLEFTRVSDRVRFHVPGEYDSITLMAWVRVDALPNRFNSLMITDGWEDGEPHWHIGSNGTLELGIQGPYKKSNAHYEALEAVTRERLNQWTHLAVVYSREGGYVAHFMDGQLIAHSPIKFDMPLRIGDAEIGNWNVATHRNDSPVRNFSGCIDEFILFSRALSEPEIEQFYSQGRPPW